MKAKRLIDFKLPYVDSISKFIKYFGVDVEDKLEGSTNTFNHISYLNLHKMGFSKVNIVWTTNGEGVAVGNIEDADDPSGVKQRDDETTTELMEFVACNPLEGKGPIYCHFERLVLHQLHEPNVGEDENHKFCNAWLQDLDNQIHNVHDLLATFYKIDNH